MTNALPPHVSAALPKIATPAYVVDMALLKRNMAVARHIREAAGCRILLATKSRRNRATA